MERVALAAAAALGQTASGGADTRPDDEAQPEVGMQGAPTVLAHLADAWDQTPQGHRPDLTRLRALLDQLGREPGRVPAAIAVAPEHSGSAVMDALLAGIAETLADEAGLDRPAWARAVPGLSETWQTPGTPRMREAARRATPPQLLARGLVLDRDSLWRRRNAAPG